ncbi:hypothetical protein FJTKL_07934 [Diaporthe vaccinii]|uniref:Uncharacterized protein n=1 Tax=Diaporthe vaccinii TaxID=105482 RepID=A0ABR4FDV7_9PEZI
MKLPPVCDDGPMLVSSAVFNLLLAVFPLRIVISCAALSPPFVPVRWRSCPQIPPVFLSTHYLIHSLLKRGPAPNMYHSLILSFSLAPILGLALPTTAPTGNLVSGSALLNATHAPKINTLSNSTHLFDTINYFPDPEVSCSGRKLSDETSNWSTDLATAVTTTTTDGVYGTCDANGSEVDGSGNLAWKSGKVQVYYCNHGFTPNPCSVNEYWRADDLINDKCGSDGGGWVKIPDWGKTIGRDPTNSDGSFRSECGASLHGVKANVVTNSTST